MMRNEKNEGQFFYEFDPTDMINEGEGWIYRTSTLSLATAIDRITLFSVFIPLVV